MKKSKFMLGTLALSMGLLGTGYAAWSDALVVNTTVSTGELDVQFVDVKGQVYGEANWELGKEDHTSEGRKAYSLGVSDEDEENGATKEAAGDDDVLTIDFSNLNPKVKLTVTAPIQNIGTLPVQLGDVDIEGVEDNGISLAVSYEGGEVLEGDVANMDTLTEDAIGKKVLYAGETGTLTYVFTVDGDNTKQNLTTGEVECKLNWVQETRTPQTENVGITVDGVKPEI